MYTHYYNNNLFAILLDKMVNTEAYWKDSEEYMYLQLRAIPLTTVWEGGGAALELFIYGWWGEH